MSSRAFYMFLYRAFAVTALVAATLAPGGPARASLITQQLVIGTEGAFPPLNFMRNGKPAGFEVELMEDLCHRMGVQCAFVAHSFEGLIPALKMGKFDAVIAHISATPERARSIAFSRPYLDDGVSFATLVDSSLLSLPGDGKAISLSDEAHANHDIDTLRPLLKGRVVGVQVSTVDAALLNRYFGNDVTVREYSTVDQHDLDLFAGRIDAVLASVPYLLDTLKRADSQSMRLVGPRFKGGVLGQGAAIGLRREDSVLRARIDQALTEAIADGSLRALSIKWLGLDMVPAASTPGVEQAEAEEGV